MFNDYKKNTRAALEALFNQIETSLPKRTSSSSQNIEQLIFLINETKKEEVLLHNKLTNKREPFDKNINTEELNLIAEYISVWLRLIIINELIREETLRKNQKIILFLNMLDEEHVTHITDKITENSKAICQAQKSSSADA